MCYTYMKLIYCIYVYVTKLKLHIGLLMIRSLVHHKGKKVSSVDKNNPMYVYYIYIFD